jgi:predicted dehydrogenase
MKLLLIGYSNVFKNRIIPVIDRLDFIDSVCIAKYQDQNWDDVYQSIGKPVILYDDYISAINHCKANLVYVSTTNHSHFFWAMESLKAGFHTIIDKPATLRLQETEDLIRMAKGKRLLLSESIVYTYHPQLEMVIELLRRENTEARVITALFSFPPMDTNNFRYKKELGGGALADTGPYAASLGRYFFGEAPLHCHYVENNNLDNGLETSYSLLLQYSKGRSLIGHFGFTTEYINRINILGERICIDIDRVFTLPDTVDNTIKVKINNQYQELNSPSGNMFELYFRAIEKCLDSNNFDKLYSDMLSDARSRDLIQKSKEHGN